MPSRVDRGRIQVLFFLVLLIGVWMVLLSQNGGGYWTFGSFVATNETTAETKTTTTISKNSSARPLLPPDPCDWIGNIDTGNRSIKCGREKCAFRSKSGQHLGYLLSANPLRVAQRTFDYAQQLASIFSIRHTYLAPPHGTNHSNCSNGHRPLDEAFDSALNKTRDGPAWWTLNTLKANQRLVVQPIELVPAKAILFKCRRWGLKDAKRRLNKLARLSSQARFERFETLLRTDLDTVLELLESKIGKCLYQDFQVFFDVEQGSILHLDLDRCFHRQTEKEMADNEKCRTKLVDYAESLINRRRPTTNTTSAAPVK